MELFHFPRFLFYQVQRGLIVIPKSVTPARIEQNFALFDFALSEDDMKTVAAFDMGSKGRIIFPVDKDGGHRDKEHPHYPFNDEY